jgi:hypothetical protein
LVDRHQEWHSRPALFGGPEGRENDTPPTPRTEPPSAARKRRTIEAGPDEIHC